jgi:hypothetical protein
MADTERLWLVERTYSDKGLVDLVYATTDGESYLRKQFSEQMLTRREVTAAIDAEPDRLEPTSAAERERYATEATRMAGRHDPDDAV